MRRLGAVATAHPRGSGWNVASPLDAALRLDPEWTMWRNLIAGLTEFSLGRYEAAATALERLVEPPEIGSYLDFWGAYNGLRLLVAAYGHLGRDSGGLKESIKRYAEDAGDREFTIAQTLVEFPFRSSRDSERLIDGLDKAGVPDLPPGASGSFGERLDGSEIASLILGHTIEGLSIETAEAYRRETAADGATKVAIGSWSDTGVTTVEGYFLCSTFLTSPRDCGMVFRNPAGSVTEKNEYAYIRQINGLMFSVVK